jgi:hypothetical protein
MKKSILLVILSTFYGLPLKGQLLLDPAGAGGFELGTTFAANGWTEVNGGTNNWCVGPPGANAGARGAFISNDGCVSASYTINVANVSHFYRDIAFPVGQATLSFNWRCFGENGFDYLDVFLCPTTITPTANFELGAVYRLRRLNLQSTWQTATIVLPCNSSAQTLRLVFSWRNDFSVGTNPPAMVDNISVFNNALPTTGLTCASAINITGFPFNQTGESTVCMNNDYTAGTPGICAGSFTSGEDRVYVYTATSALCLGVMINNTNTDQIGFAVYSGCPGSGGSCIGWATVPALGNSVTTTINLPAAGTYYFIVDGVNATYDISIISYGAGPANDRPCNATFLPFGIYLSGNNTCSGTLDEPTMPAACSPWGTVNSVWYRFIAPASGCVKIKTILGTLTNTIIAAYTSGVAPVSCGSGATLTYIACNNDEPACGSFVPVTSTLTLSGLSPGFSYYIVVDGVNNLTGSFSILAIDGGAGCANPLPPAPGQDCVAAIPVCSNTINVPDPGYQGVGNICDFGNPSPCTGGTSGCGPCATTCLCAGERGSSWYLITICGNGFLEFWIVPNNWPGPPSISGTDYDFAIYGPNPSCSNLTSPIRCHYSPLGVTGVYGTTPGMAPPGYPGFGSAFRERIPVTAGETYLLNVSNYSINTSGFTLYFASTAPVCYGVSPGGTIVWTGSVSTDWFNTNNWGGCQIPDCSRNAIISSFPVNQPVINAANASVRSITITPGASLTINAGFQLMVCNDFTNNGTFNALAGSTVLFTDTAVTPPLTNLHDQNINGSVTGANRFMNVTVDKPTGYRVIANQDIDMGGNFTIVSTGGSFDATGRYHRVAGNFTVNFPSFYTTGTDLEFNGSVQTYLNRGIINNVVMNQTAPGTLTLQNHGAATAWMLLSGTGNLILNYGRIITNATANNRVEVQNRSFTAITPGNANSYIETNGIGGSVGLRKYLNQTGATGTYEFPVGTSAKGYQRLSLNLTAGLPTGVNFLTVQFDNAVPANNTTLGIECGLTYHTPPATPLDNGFWRFIPTPAGSFSNGTFTPTLYNTGYTNAQAGYTVMYNRSGSNTAANWLINTGSPVCGNPVTAVQRTGMSVATVFQSAGNVWFGTAQAPNPLPVEWLSFSASERKDHIQLHWITASEKDNKGFEIERSRNGVEDFHAIAFVSGKGNTTTQSHYHYADYDVKPEVTYYYRLRQIDFSGQVKYSNVIAARISQQSVHLSILPNPYQHNTSIVYILSEDAHIRLDVFNNVGQKVATLQDGQLTAGTYSHEFAARSYGFSHGIYTVRLIINHQEVLQRRLLEMP